MSSVLDMELEDTIEAERLRQGGFRGLAEALKRERDIAVAEVERLAALIKARAAQDTLARVRSLVYERRRCVYCGHRCYGLTCRGHRDLLKLDPLYAAS